MRYTVTVHVPTPELDERALEDLRAALERGGLEVTELVIHGGSEEGERWLHLSAPVEAISGYDARRVKGPALFSQALSNAGIVIAQDDLLGVLTPRGEEA